MDSKNPKDHKDQEKPIDLDSVLVNELGQFGRFQLKNILIVTIPMIMTGFLAEYVFSAAAIPHRCQIPECGENGRDELFEPDWITNAIPNSNSGLASCERFVPLGGNGSLDMCPIDLFDQHNTAACNGFVYERQNSVVYEFDLGCQELTRTLAGTFNSIGTLFSLPISGYISDNFGRKITLIVNLFNLGLFGIIKAFSVNYVMYLAMHLLQTTFGASGFTTGYIFATELVGPKYRVITSATCSSMFALGQVITGAVAWAIEPWRYMIIAVSVPYFLIISYYWFMTESVRWLLSKQRYDEAKVILEKVAKVNRTHLSEKSLKALMTPPSLPATDKSDQPSVTSAILKSPILLRRVCTTPIWWVTTTFVYYGLSLNATSLSVYMHLNFILACAVEIPGFFAAVLFLDRIGRRATLSIGYFLCAACNIAFVFIPSDLIVLRIVIYLLGKFGISMVMTSMYLYTSELYPTQYRQTLLAFSSMIGRIGSIAAPLTPALIQYWHGIPSLMFGCLAMLSGVLVLTQPETLGTRMPDTLAEAEALGRERPVVVTRL